MSDVTHELKITFENTDKHKVLEELSLMGRDDWVDSYDDLDIDDDIAESLIETMIEKEDEALGISFYSYSRKELSDLSEVLFEKFPNISLKLHSFDSIIWTSAWEEKYEAFETRYFYISPSHEEKQTEKLWIKMDPGKAFGSGQHATTKACIEHLERFHSVGSSKGKSFLDVGTGTGVLCFAAHYFGYETIVGTDIDPDSFASVDVNKKLNSIDFELVKSSMPEAQLFDLIVSNILPPTVTNLIPSFCNYLKDSGELYLSGFNESNEEAVLSVLEENELKLVDRHVLRGWISLKVVKKS